MFGLRPLSTAALCTFGLCLSACGNGAAPSGSSASAATTSAPAARPSPTATTPAVTAAPAASSSGAAGGACSIAGDWKGQYPPGPYPFSGHSFEISFNADGTARTDSERAKQQFAWKMDAGALALHGTKVERGGQFTCPLEDVGKYTLTFTPNCASVTLKLASDPCQGRAKIMDGVTFKRK